MGTPNVSRDTYPTNAPKHYDKLVEQQDVPVLDADINELQDIQRRKLQSIIAEIVGDGSVNSGFQCVGNGSSNNFLINAGTMYCKGYYCSKANQESYTAQVDYPSPAALTPPTSGNRTDTIYLHVYEQDIDSTQDTYIKDPTLNVETCQRIKLTFQVEVAQGGVTPTSTATDFYTTLAILTRYPNQGAINVGDIVDARPLIQYPLDTISPFIAEVIGGRPRNKIVNAVYTGLSGNTYYQDATVVNQVNLLVEANVRLAGPTGGFDGQKIVYRLQQDSGGSRTINPVPGLGNFNFSPDVPSPLPFSTAPGAIDYMGIVYNATRGMWDVVAFVSGF